MIDPIQLRDTVIDYLHQVLPEAHRPIHRLDVIAPCASSSEPDTVAIHSGTIAQAEAHRVEQMLRVADDQPAGEAESALQTIEGLLVSMRRRRSLVLSERATS